VERATHLLSGPGGLSRATPLNQSTKLLKNNRFDTYILFTRAFFYPLRIVEATAGLSGNSEVHQKQYSDQNNFCSSCVR